MAVEQLVLPHSCWQMVVQFQKATADTGKDWDKLLPYLLFAYRNVPQASTGFALSELWSSESVVSHVLAMRDKLASMQSWYVKT